MAGPEDDRRRERIFRALTVIDELKLNDATTARLYPVLSSYEQDRTGLLDEYSALVERIARTTDPAAADKLLDQSLATQRALIAVEAKLVIKLRQILPADQAARARVMLLATSPPPAPPIAAAVPPHAKGHDPGALFPPGSPMVARCDPFAQMHRCPE